MCCLGSACTEPSESYPAKYSKSQIRETQGNPEAKPQRVSETLFPMAFLPLPFTDPFQLKGVCDLQFQEGILFARLRQGDWLSNHPYHLQALQLATIPSLL